MAGDRTEIAKGKAPLPGAEPTSAPNSTTSASFEIKPERSKEIAERRRLATQYCSKNSFNAKDATQRNALRNRFIKRPLCTGIAFSGGGIRSATISLGLTEALAAHGRFYAFDMMSTVSGGGYFGTFLRSLYINREAGKGGTENNEIVDADKRLAFADAVITSLPDQQYFRSKSDSTDNSYSSYFIKPNINKETNLEKRQAIKNPLWWLRENGRYIAPNGMTDYLFALAFFVQNWITMMITILAAMLFVFACLHAITLTIYAIAPELPAFVAATKAATAAAKAVAASSGTVPDIPIQWSPVLAMLTPGLLILIGIGLGYWFSLGLTINPLSADRNKDVRRIGLWWVGCGLMITGLLLFDPLDRELGQRLENGALVVLMSALMSSGINALRRDAPPDGKIEDEAVRLRRIRISLLFALICLLGIFLAGLVIANLADCLPSGPQWSGAIIALATALIICMIAAFSAGVSDPISVAGYYRRLQTRTLSQAAVIVAVLAIFGLIDTLGLSIRAVSSGANAGSFEQTALTSSALLSLIATLVAKLPDWIGGSKLGIIRILKANASSVAFIAAVVMLIALAVLADLLILKSVWESRAWACDPKLSLVAFAMISGGALIVVLLIGQSKLFLNQTALAPIYAARLGRAYLGGSNCYRLATHTDSDITRGMIGDDMGVDYYMQQNCAAPLHFINVTRNRTTGTANSGATVDINRTDDDPFVMHEATHLRRRLEGYDSNLTLRDRKGDRMVIGPAGIRAGADFFSWNDITSHANKSEQLRLSQICAISGAAVSSGMGRLTTLGTAMALTLANVRLGHWWRAPERHGIDKERRHKEPTGLRKWLHSYEYLYDEFRAHYDRDKPYWYLSDGGHAENSGALTLLERNCGFILVADNGQDPDSDFADLETFVRTARTDIGMEVVAANKEELADIIHRDAHRCFLNAKPESWAVQLKSSENEAFALLLKASDIDSIENGKCRPSTVEPSWIVWLKPTLFKGLPVDIMTYGRLNVEFPQQSTANQFFDEAQWESYRRLGFAMGSRLFANPDTLANQLPLIFQAFALEKESKKQ